MAFIRNKETELTGFQESAPFNSNFDIQTDFVMVYGTDKTMPDRIKKYSDHGYVVHLMTGIAWGEYQDYLLGDWDGKDHWEESQMDRNGRHIKHGDTVPYMVPTISFTNYLTEKLKVAVDSGVLAIHLEEPEFWDHGGYSEAFKREYKLYYRKDWQPPHESLEARYNSSKLKAYLYARALDRICGELKEYALKKYNRVVRFYVPTHSLVNYTQWKIMSPEGSLIDLPTIDGFIAQIWTGTSRSENVFEGSIKERTFETSYLEYGIMQELVKGTGRKMWFLHDPIEDNPEYPWEDFKYNYLKTVTASLLHPVIHNYEVCPWPNRVFNGVYPRSKRTGKLYDNAKTIPQDYNTLLCNMVNTLGDMDKDEYSFDECIGGVGVLMSDTGLYQRTYPDNVLSPDDRSKLEKDFRNAPDEIGEKTVNKAGALDTAQHDETAMKTFISSGYFPNFYGLSLPLLKYGLPVRPVQLDNIRRYPGYFNDYSTLILSYEFIKPISPDINNSLAAWVKSGGSLIYVGDGSDPYFGISSWWNTGTTTYANPAQHLFEMLGLNTNLKDGTYKVGKGVVAIKNICPAKLCMTAENASDYREFVKKVLADNGKDWKYTNKITLKRGEYIINAVMNESINDEPAIFEGVFADMFTPKFDIITKKIVNPDENTMLADVTKLKGNCIVGTSARILSFDDTSDAKQITMEVLAPNTVNAHIRIKSTNKIATVTSPTTNVSFEYYKLSDTYLISYASIGEKVEILCK